MNQTQSWIDNNAEFQAYYQSSTLWRCNQEQCNQEQQSETSEISLLMNFVTDAMVMHADAFRN